MIEYSFADYISVITINRPEKANALTGDMLHALTAAIDKSRESRAVILTGTGKIFSAGASLDEVKTGLATDPAWEVLSHAIANLRGLTVCALNGTLAGGAFGMALACDMRIAVPDTRFFYPVMKMGVLPQPSDPARMKALIGPSRTKMLLLSGQKIDSQTAHRWGLIDTITTPDGLMDHAHDLTQTAQNTPISLISDIKTLING